MKVLIILGCAGIGYFLQGTDTTYQFVATTGKKQIIIIIIIHNATMNIDK